MTNKKKQTTATALTPEDFTGQPEVKAVMAELQEQFLKQKKVVSDVLDEEGNQYVNLVQEGGGVLGVALVGYTYVLEEMGIRFMRLAGTSAGAINTAMMAVIGEKEAKKSGAILEHLSNKDIFEFVDGHPVAKKIIKNFITNESFVEQSKKWLKYLLYSLCFFIVVDIVGLGLQH